MAAADTARLIASLELQDKFTKTADKALGKVDRIDKRLGAFSGAVNRNLARGVDAVVARGVNFFTDSVREGLDSLAELESATTAVDGAIAKTGKTGEISSKQIADWANEIEAATQAAFDDKEITAYTADLIRFGKVTTGNIQPAMVVMTDLAAKTGDVGSASKALAKALADPTRASSILRRQSIFLTKQQQKQIDAMVKAGDVAGAQRVLLEELAKTTGGAAADSVGKYGDAIHMLSDAGEDAKKALAEGFLPVIERVAGKLSDIVADPKAMQSLRDFGKGVAGAFDDVVDFLEGVNWRAVGDGLGAAAGFAKTLFDAFANMPPEVQGTIIALAGLNKLSGGAVTGIVSELGKGLIKGVLGMTAGVVNLTAGTVTGVPGAAGTAGGAAGAAGAAGGVREILSVAGAATLAVGVGFAMREAVKEISSSLFPPELATAIQKSMSITNPLIGLADTLESIPSGLESIVSAIKGIGTPTNKPSTYQNAFGPNPVNQGGQMKGWADAQKAWVDNGRKITDLQHGAVDAIDGSKDAVVEAQGQAKREVAARVGQAGNQTSNAATGAGSRVTTQSIANTSRMVGAIYASTPTVNVSTVVNVTAAQVTKATTTQTRYGPGGGSAADDDPNGAGK